MRRCRLKVFCFLALSSRQESLVKGHQRNISVKLFENWCRSRYHLKVFLFSALTAILFIGS